MIQAEGRIPQLPAPAIHILKGPVALSSDSSMTHVLCTQVLVMLMAKAAQYAEAQVGQTTFGQWAVRYMGCGWER